MGERWTPGYTVRTSKVVLGPPRVQTGPLEWDPEPPPPYGVRAAHNGVPRFRDRTHSGLEQDLGGGPVPTRVQTRTCLHTLLLPAQAETRCCHMAYCARLRRLWATHTSAFIADKTCACLSH
jgi:hypothetical protein